MNEEDPVKEGYVRIYEDHTGRWYQDVLESELIPDENTLEGMLYKILCDEVRKEIDSDMSNNMKNMYLKIKNKQ